MKYFLMLIILGLCGAGYYEYNALLLKSAKDLQQISDQSTQIDTLQAQNKKLADDNAKLAKDATGAQAEMAELTQQVQAAQSALVLEQQQAAQAKAAATAPVAAPTPTPLPSNHLGDIATLDGKSYQSCLLLKVQADGIVVNDATGITQVPYTVMPPELQKRFGFDPHQGSVLPPDRVAMLEEKRKAAGN